MNRKSQSAMEYLMTYGWAILVVLIALGALFYLGVFSPTVPNVCNIPAPFSCQDIKLADTGDTLTLRIGSTGLTSITYTNPAQAGPTSAIKLNGVGCVISNDGDTNYDGDAVNMKSSIVDVICTSTLTKGTKFSGTITFNYQRAGGLPHTTEGSFSGTVE